MHYYSILVFTFVASIVQVLYLGSFLTRFDTFYSPNVFLCWRLVLKLCFLQPTSISSDDISAVLCVKTVVLEGMMTG